MVNAQKSVNSEFFHFKSGMGEGEFKTERRGTVKVILLDDSNTNCLSQARKETIACRRELLAVLVIIVT